ncbi:MAG: SNF2 family helicase [Alphaproteobacteria bacterium]|nr:SNF2 family helicase [Alphaproteobacteria bacterium]
MVLDEGDIRSQLGEETLEAGRLCHQQGCVLEYRPVGVLTTATVRGSGKEPYRQKISVTGSRAGKISIHGVCSCDKGLGCRHIAAVLLEGLARQKAASESADALAASKPASGKGRSAAAGPALVKKPAFRAPSVTWPVVRPALDRFPAAPPVDPTTGLPASLSSWLGGLADAAEADTDGDPGEGAERLVYVLWPERSAGANIARLKLVVLRREHGSDGLFRSHAGIYNFRMALREGNRESLSRSDLRIARRMAAILNHYASPSSPSDSLFQHDGSFDVLELILATGRARWGSGDGPMLSLGAARQGRMVWEQSEDGSATRISIDAGEGGLCLQACRLLYVDPKMGLIGPLETGVARRIVDELVAVPPFAAEHAAKLAEHMVQKVPALKALLPPPPPPPVVHREKPRVRLRLMSARFPVRHRSEGWYEYLDDSQTVERETVALARITFHYGSATVELDDRRQLVEGGGAVKIRRDDKAEAEAVRTLHSMGLEPVSPFVGATGYGNDFLPARSGGQSWPELLYHGLPRLSKLGWDIEINDDFPFELLSGAEAFSAEVVESSETDWFDLDVGVRIGGEVVDLVPSIVEMIGAAGFDPSRFLDSAGEGGESAGDQAVVFLPVGEGRFVGVPHHQIAPIIAAIWELSLVGGTGRERPRLSLMDLAALAAFEEAMRRQGMQLRAGGKLREMGRRLSASGGFPEVTLPGNFTAQLRPYQAQGVAWLALLDELRIGGVLADDMGLGKTVQALALIAVAKAAGRLEAPALILAPTSLMTNWRREAARFAPDLSVLVLHGADRKERFGAIAGADIVLSTYPLLSRDHETLAAQEWSLIFLDEAQTIKNARAETTRLARALKARTRFCLTGTPLENHLGELWSLFSIAVPGLLGDQKSFGRIFRTPIEKLGDKARGRLLARRVRPFLLRRTKDDVASELPPKIEIIERIAFEPAQSRVYEAIRLSMHDKVRAAITARGFAQSHLVILHALVQMRQCCCDPRLLRLSDRAAADAGSVKLERLMAMLEELMEQDRRVLVFSNFVSMLRLIEAELQARDMDYALLTGDTKDRAGQIDSFQDGSRRIFLLSLKVGGVGLNLTAADTVILYDPWWNPAAEAQAVDRAHRIGQDKHVFVHQLVVAGTIEEKMLPIKEKKRALAETVFDRESGSALGVGEEDLDRLFEPTASIG